MIFRKLMKKNHSLALEEEGPESYLETRISQRLEAAGLFSLGPVKKKNT